MNREAEIHTQFVAWLEKHGYGFIHCRTDRKSTVQVGMPDFLVAKDGRCIFIEIKIIGAKRSPVQLAMAKKLESSGNTVEVAYSLPECIFAVETLLAGHSGGQPIKTRSRGIGGSATGHLDAVAKEGCKVTSTTYTYTPRLTEGEE